MQQYDQDSCCARLVRVVFFFAWLSFGHHFYYRPLAVASYAVIVSFSGQFCPLKVLKGLTLTLTPISLFSTNLNPNPNRNSQVDSTASYNAALTVDGDLLTWRCTATTTKPSAPLSMLDRLRNPQAWTPESQGSRGFTVDDDAGCTRSRRHSSSSFSSSVCPANSEHAGHPTTPTVWQALACKPSVSDVACGHKHTLALLETGQVKTCYGVGIPSPLLRCYDQ